MVQAGKTAIFVAEAYFFYNRRVKNGTRKGLSMVNIEIERLHKEHWPEVREIYEMGIQTGKATFEKKRLPGKSGQRHMILSAGL